MAYLDPYFEEKIKSLPEDLQRAILNLNFHQKMLDILHRYDLLISEGSDLYDEVEKVLVGESAAANFPEKVISRLEGVEEEVLPKIIADVDKEIFQPIKADLMRIEGFKKASASDRDEVEADHLKLNKDVILSGIEAPISSSLHSRAAKSGQGASPADEEDGETDPFDKIVKEVVNEFEPETETDSEIEDDEEEENEPFIRPAGNLPPDNQEIKKKEEWQTAIDAKRAEDFKKNISGESADPEKPEVLLPAGIKSTVPNLVDTKLSQMVKSPKEEIEVKLPDQEPKKPAIDPYREPTK